MENGAARRKSVRFAVGFIIGSVIGFFACSGFIIGSVLFGVISGAIAYFTNMKTGIAVADKSPILYADHQRRTSHGRNWLSANALTKAVTAVTALFLALCLAFPPWVYVTNTASFRRSEPFRTQHFIMDPPYAGANYGVGIDYGRLIMELGIIAGIGGAAMLTASAFRRKSPTASPAPSPGE